MEFLVLVSWLAIFLVTPIAFAVVGTGSYHAGQDFASVLIKVFFGFTMYFLSTIISVAFLTQMLTTAFAEQGLTPLEEFTYVFVLICYGASGWLLCSLIKGSYVNPFENLFYVNKTEISITGK